MSIRLDTVPATGRTDGQTELVKQYRALHCMLSCDKKEAVNVQKFNIGKKKFHRLTTCR